MMTTLVKAVGIFPILQWQMLVSLRWLLCAAVQLDMVTGDWTVTLCTDSSICTTCTHAPHCCSNSVINGHCTHYPFKRHRC